jgi:hypothetical protein
MLVQLVTLEGARLNVARVRHPRTQVACLAFSNPEGHVVAVVPRELVASVRDRLWQVSSKDGFKHTLGPVDVALLRRFARA